jgi:hypothetical protein
MSLNTGRSRIGAALFAVLLVACNSSVENVDPGADEAGSDGGGGGDGSTGADAIAPASCGLLTTLCKDGEKCAAAPDCVSKICFGGICQTPKPADGTKNGDETDVDCGGSKSPACADGKGCLAVTDCTSGVCTAGKCQAPTATDGVRNGDETGTDCGGSKAPKCLAGQGCATSADCDQLKCNDVQKKCEAASHTDGIKNDGETGTDCGGSALTKCPTGQGCVATTDCDAAKCDVGATNLCLAPSHTDGVKNLGETGTDCGGAASTKCPTGQGCVATSDCDLAKCDVGATNLCLAPAHDDGIKNLGETGIDCGGAAAPAKKCPTGQGCAGDGDCNNVLCKVLVCDSPRSNDHLTNGTETDEDCGGGAPTNAPGCAVGLTCALDADCGSKACFGTKCVESVSCKTDHGGNTCGPNGNESCCKSLTTGGASPVNLDKYNITAGRFRQFVEYLVTNNAGSMRAWLMANTPAGWPANWTAMLPTMLDNGGTNPDFTGIYQELGPNVHPPSSVGANEGCFIDNFGARTYRLPDAVNTRMSDPQYYTQAFLDERPLVCVPPPMLAAFCAWDGGKLATKEQIDVAWGAAKYPWGAQDPAGYRYAYDDDPMGGAGYEEAFGGFQGAPIVAGPFPLTAFYADYNYNFWGGASKTATAAAEDYKGKTCALPANGNGTLNRAAGTCGWRDYSIFISPPGRFPTGNSTTGHADLAGNVFNGTLPSATDGASYLNGTDVHWSRSGSWQGHNIPWTAKGSWLGVPAYYKYWAMGGRCVH